jgi:hypothetical protein
MWIKKGAHSGAFFDPHLSPRLFAQPDRIIDLEHPLQLLCYFLRQADRLGIC